MATAAAADAVKDAALGFQWISQLNPTGATDAYTNGAMNCGPAAGAMIARACGYGTTMNDAALVTDLAGFAHTNDLGTTGNGMIAMYEEMGLETAATPGANMDWINAELAAGHYVTALGDYYEVPIRENNEMTAGHYLDVTAYEAATKQQAARYSVADPASQEVNYMTAAELQNFITSAPSGGFAISCWQAAAALNDAATALNDAAAAVTASKTNG